VGAACGCAGTLPRGVVAKTVDRTGAAFASPPYPWGAITVTIGIAACPGDGHFSTLEDLVRLAESDDGSPGQGLAGFARAGSGTPTALRALAAAGGIRLEWQAPPLGVPSRYQIEAGRSPGARDVLVHTTTGADTAFETARPAGGTFFVRVRAQDAGGATSGPSNEVALVFGCTAPPRAPFVPTVSLAGSRVSIGWSQPGYSDATHAVIEAGSGPGLANLARLVTTAPAPFEADAPAGTYFVRVRAANACGESAPSNDVSFTVGSGAFIPARPEWTRAEVGPGTVTLSWAAVAGAAGYLIEAGRRPRSWMSRSCRLVPSPASRYEYVSRFTPHFFVRILAALLVVAAFDNLLFAGFLRFGHDDFLGTMAAGLVSKAGAALFYSAALWAYLRFVEPREVTAAEGDVADVFQMLTYRQRYEQARAQWCRRPWRTRGATTSRSA
jgi:hypothetical protein